MKLSDAKEQFTSWLLARGRRESTAEAYTGALNGYSRFLKKHPEAVSLPHAKRVEMYLTMRVREDDIAASTRALN